MLCSTLIGFTYEAGTPERVFLNSGNSCQSATVMEAVMKMDDNNVGAVAVLQDGVFLPIVREAGKVEGIVEIQNLFIKHSRI